VDPTTKNPATEPVFVDLLRGPGIDSQPGGPVRNPICRTGPPGYTGWRNRFLGIDAWAPETFTNTGSGKDSERRSPRASKVRGGDSVECEDEMEIKNSVADPHWSQRRSGSGSSSKVLYGSGAFVIF
jgi:hypothetical protein